MKPTRRQFIQGAAAAGALYGLAATSPYWMRNAFASAGKAEALTELLLRDNAFAREQAKKKLDLLVLGGTGFLGPACTEVALARGHTVTHFNRGRTNAHLYPQIEKIEGDRREAHDGLRGRKWDCVLDTSAYFPRVVHNAMDALDGNVEHYVLISTISVYAAFDQPGMDETAPVATIEDQTTEEVTGESYGALKALCEQAAETRMPGRVTNIRPGLIVGPLDRTDRFTYWPVRVARGGEVLAPGTPEQTIQVIDVRDLANFAVRAMEERIAGVYNATSSPGLFSMGELLETSRKVSGSDASFTWVSPEFLAEHEVAPWSEMPVWMPPEGEYAGFDQVNVSRAVAKGLSFRPLTQTVRDTLDWWKTMPELEEDPRTELRAGIAPEKEKTVLEAWHARGDED
jgi:2'-hydroxyisoflavone reductase